MISGFESQKENERPLLENNLHVDDSIDDVGITRKHSAWVTILGSGRQMYKATLTSLLNQDPTLSHDRYVLQ